MRYALSSSFRASFVPSVPLFFFFQDKIRGKFVLSVLCVFSPMFSLFFQRHLCLFKLASFVFQTSLFFLD
jgi:hypothetical protein